MPKTSTTTPNVDPLPSSVAMPVYVIVILVVCAIIILAIIG